MLHRRSGEIRAPRPMRALPPMRLLLDRARQRPHRVRSMDQACAAGRNRGRGLGQDLTAALSSPVCGGGGPCEAWWWGVDRRDVANEGAFRNHRPCSRTGLALSVDDAADALRRMAIEMAAAAAPTTALRAVPLPRFAGEDR